MVAVAHLFDNLPTDIIYYEIFPFLDYDSRVTANAMLPPIDRHKKKLRSEALLKFTMKLSTCRLKTILNAYNKATNPVQRNRLMLRLWRTVPKHSELLRHCEKFRCIVQTKAEYFSNLPQSEKDYLTYYSVRTLKALCEHVLKFLNKDCPFVREVSTDSMDASFVW